ncbi:MAG: B12-binding domain-containing radical SAM protein [bacterium]|nr:B12-binding domain-containing radical SAM protein [bacterium]
MRGNKIVFLRVYEPHRPPVITPPLGIASLIRYLKEKHNGLEFKTYDFATDKDVMDKIISDNKGEEPIFFGISGMLKNYSLIHRTAASLKNHFPSVPIVVGGPVVSSLKRLTLNSKHIDYAIANEGEVPLSMLLKSITDGNPPLSSIPSLIYRNNGEIFQNPNESAILREDEIPMPDLEAVDITKYFKFQGFEHAGIRPYLPLMTSRGCPYSCVYCHGIFGQKVRFVPTEKITEHIKYYTKKYSIKDIEIYDDIFNINENRAKDIITEILKINPDIHFLFPNGLRTDILSKDFISFLGTHNTSYISIAVESASERIQKLIKKRLDLDKLKANVELLSKYKILLHAYFMLGFPTETKEEMLKTIDFAKRLPVHTASFFKVTPHLGTELFEMCSEEIKENIISDAINTDNIRYYSPKINISSVDNKVLNRLHKYAVLSFYLRPKQLVKILSYSQKIKNSLYRRENIYENNNRKI